MLKGRLTDTDLAEMEREKWPEMDGGHENTDMGFSFFTLFLVK